MYLLAIIYILYTYTLYYNILYIEPPTKSVYQDKAKAVLGCLHFQAKAI